MVRIRYLTTRSVRPETRYRASYDARNTLAAAPYSVPFGEVVNGKVEVPVDEISK